MHGWARCSFQIKCTETHYVELFFLHLVGSVDLFFLHLVGSVGHIVHSGATGAQKIDALFFMLRWDWYVFHKKHARTHYTELAFLHLVGSVGHVVHYSASMTQNVDVLFFMLLWARYAFRKKRVG
jgi:hypothetical protein